MSVYALIAAVLTPAVFVGVTTLLKPRWEQRNIDVTRKQVIITAAATLAIGLLTFLIGGSAAITISIATTTYLFTLSAFTDLKSGLMPKELAWTGSAIGVILFALAPLTMLDRFGVLFAVAVMTGAPFWMWMRNKGIGMGDVRIIAAGALLTAWWISPITPMLAFLVAGILQIALRTTVPAHIRDRFSLTTPEDSSPRYPFGPALAVGFIGISLLALVPLMF